MVSAAERREPCEELFRLETRPADSRSLIRAPSARPKDHLFEGSSLERAGYLDRGMDGSGVAVYNEKTGESDRLRRPVISEDG
jgi:hypothetical protein